MTALEKVTAEINRIQAQLTDGLADGTVGADFGRIRQTLQKDGMPMASVQGIGCQYEVWSMVSLEDTENGVNPDDMLIICVVAPYHLRGSYSPAKVKWSGEGIVNALVTLTAMMAKDIADNA